MPRNLKSRVGPPVNRACPRGRVLNYMPVGSEEQSTIFLKFTYFVCWSSVKRVGEHIVGFGRYYQTLSSFLWLYVYSFTQY